MLTGVRDDELLAQATDLQRLTYGLGLVVRSHVHAESQLAAVADHYIWTEVIPAPKKLPWAFTAFLKFCRAGVAAFPWLGDARSVVNALLDEASAANT